MAGSPDDAVFVRRDGRKEGSWVSCNFYFCLVVFFARL